jgi:hypothetical protein
MSITPSNMITPEQQQNLLQQLQQMQDMLNNMSGGNSNAGQYGASGRGEWMGQLTGQQQEDLFSNPQGDAYRDSVSQKMDGESDSEHAERIRNSYFALAGDGGMSNGGGGQNSFSRSDSVNFAKSNGLEGLGYDTAFAGLSPQFAKQQADKIKTRLQGQTSSLTSSVFNNQTTAGLKKASDNLNFKLKDVSNDSWLSNGSKEDKKKVLLETTAGNIAKLFQSPEDFQNQYNSNQAIKNSIDTFQQQGGDINSITSNIAKPAVDNGNAEQSISTYLDSLAADTTAGKKAQDLLAPEKEIAQSEITQLAGIPQQYKDLYFGSPEQIGILQEKQQQAEEEKKLLQKKASDEENNLRAQADFAIQQNNADFEIAKASVEENRLNAKNYMTGMLAKLGALNTTGAAPQAILTLDEKYQRQATQLQLQATQNNQSIHIKLTDAINNVENDRDNQILKLQQDLTLDKETVLKEVNKLQASSAKSIYDIVGKYAKDLRTQTEKYKAEATKQATAYTKSLASVLSTSDISSLVEGSYVVKGKTKGVVGADGKILPISLTPTQQQQIESAGIKGLSEIRFFLSTDSAFRNQFITDNTGNGGTPSLALLRNEYENWKSSKSKPKAGSSSSKEITINDL